MTTKGQGVRPQALPLLALFLGAACAGPAVWKNPNAAEEERSRDLAECQSLALDQVEREYALSQQTGSSLNYDLGGQWSGQMDRYAAQQRQQQLFENCMTRRGYRLVPTGG